MKLASTVLASLLVIEGASAFAPTSLSGIKRSTLASTVVAEAPVEVKEVSEEKENDTPVVAVSEPMAVESPVVKVSTTNSRIQPGRYADIEKSLALPFMKRPAALDGTHAGDIGFDPLGLTEEYDLYTMMESETRHGRLAMLAVAGWPMAELFGPKWLLQGDAHLAPSVLNGFNPVTFLATAAIFGGFGFLEYKTALRRVDNTKLGKKHKEDMADIWEYGVPGDYNFDPLDFYSLLGDDAQGRKGLRDVEIAHGRYAMVGITYFALWEYLTKTPIVDNNPLFHPNLLVPLLGIAYLSFGFFFEIKNTDEKLLQIETTSEGKSRITRINSMMEEATKDSDQQLWNMVDITEKFIETMKGLKAKYDNVNESYTNNVMSYANEDKKN